MSYSARGFVVLHAVPFSISRQVEWTISRELPCEPQVRWMSQTALPGHLHTTLQWEGPTATGARLTSALAGWFELWFEISQEPAAGVDGSIWMYTPELGIVHRNIDACGNIQIGENQLRVAISDSVKSVKALRDRLDFLLAKPWLDELEPLRVGQDGSGAVWLAG